MSQAREAKIHAVVAGVDGGDEDEAAGHDGAAREALISSTEGAKEGDEEERGPDHLAEKQGLAHRGGLHVEQARIEREEERRDDGSRGTHPVARQTPEASDAKDVAGHGGDGAGDAVLPPGHAGGEGHHEQVRKRQPHRADLANAGVQRVEDAAGDMQVRDGVSV